MEKKERDPRWATCCDEHGDYTGSLVASRTGLEYLRSRIDEALEKGEAKVDATADFDFTSIKIEDIHPSDRLKPKPVLDSVAKVGCLSLLAIAIILIIIGAYSLWDMIASGG